MPLDDARPGGVPAERGAEAPPGAGRPRGDRLGWLRSQGLGLACGYATVVLLAVGSVVLTATRDGASAPIHMDDLRGFFTPVHPAHLWLYLLFPVAALYALNTVLATWDTVVRKWRAGVRAPTAYAASVVHVGFLLALAAHVAGGFLGRDGAGVLVASGWQDLPGFGEVRLLSLEVDALPDGMPREAWARLEVRDAAGRLAQETVGYNVPLSAGGGASLALLVDLGRTWVARIAAGDAACALAEGQRCRIAGEDVRLVRLVPGEGGAPAAVVGARGPSGADQVRLLARGGALALPRGGELRLAAIASEQAVVLRTREAPGNPWALAASLVMGAGIALLWRKLVR
ncbi:MAG TPA: hypothetical protein VF894_05415 [Anaeromyxobacter sp.]